MLARDDVLLYLKLASIFSDSSGLMFVEHLAGKANHDIENWEGFRVSSLRALVHTGGQQ